MTRHRPYVCISASCISISHPKPTYHRTVPRAPLTFPNGREQASIPTALRIRTRISLVSLYLSPVALDEPRGRKLTRPVQSGWGKTRPPAARQLRAVSVLIRRICLRARHGQRVRMEDSAVVKTPEASVGRRTIGFQLMCFLCADSFCVYVLRKRGKWRGTEAREGQSVLCRSHSTICPGTVGECGQQRRKTRSKSDACSALRTEESSASGARVSAQCGCARQRSSRF